MYSEGGCGGEGRVGDIRPPARIQSLLINRRSQPAFSARLLSCSPARLGSISNRPELQRPRGNAPRWEPRQQRSASAGGSDGRGTALGLVTCGRRWSPSVQRIHSCLWHGEGNQRAQAGPRSRRVHSMDMCMCSHPGIRTREARPDWGLIELCARPARVRVFSLWHAEGAVQSSRRRAHQPR
jgi:hypothetical protein